MPDNAPETPDNAPETPVTPETAAEHIAARISDTANGGDVGAAVARFFDALTGTITGAINNASNIGRGDNRGNSSGVADNAGNDGGNAGNAGSGTDETETRAPAQKRVNRWFRKLW